MSLQNFESFNDIETSLSKLDLFIDIEDKFNLYVHRMAHVYYYPRYRTFAKEKHDMYVDGILIELHKKDRPLKYNQDKTITPLVEKELVEVSDKLSKLFPNLRMSFQMHREDSEEICFVLKYIKMR